MQAIGYVRVSTDRQAELGVSLEAQESKIRAMASLQGAEIVRGHRGRWGVGQEFEPPRPAASLTLVDSGKSKP